MNSQTPVWVDVLTAFGTLGAVLVALYVSVVREWRRTPKLSLALTSESHTGYSFGFDPGGTAGIATLAVRNARGRRTAQDVQVLLTVWSSQFPDYRRVNQRSLRWWYGDDQLDHTTAITKETLGPGVTRHIALMLVGHSKAVCDAALGPDFWEALGDETKQFHREHRHGIWAVSPLDTEGSGWFEIDESLNLAVTVTAHDVNAQTFYSQVRLSVHSVAPTFNVLRPSYAIFTTERLGRTTFTMRDAESCPNPDCHARNWPWELNCWRCNARLYE